MSLNLFHIARVSFCLGLLACCCACQRQKQPETHGADGIGSMKELHPKVDYATNEAQRDIVMKAANHLELGTSVEAVVQSMGSPSVDKALYHKGATPAFRARILRYYLAPDTGKNNDPAVDLVFDERNRLIEVYSTVKEVANRRLPNVTHTDSTP